MEDEQRKELIRIWNILQPRITKTLEEEVLPSSITHNGDKAGITIEFRNFYPNDKESVSDSPVPSV